MVNSETGEPVGREDIGRGYEYAKGQYIMVEDEELAKIKIESTHTIDIDSFVPRSEIDDRYLESPYYIAPTDKVGQEAFSVIRDAMREKKMAGLARVVLTRREHVVMLEPFDKGLLATTLRYPYEIRDHADYFGELPELKLPAEMMKLAGHIVDTKAGHFDPKKFEDNYEQALVSLLKSKEAGRPVETIGEEKGAPRVINLMDALKASINASAKKPAAASAGERRPARKKASAR
jgi:DNA end-binding protein Ku